jgi:S1-C subfamily serine protease
MVAMALLVCGFPVSADELAEQGRQVLDQYKKSVVTINLVIKQQFSMSGFGSQDQESKEEVTGTVIDPSGLTVVALSTTDPTSMIQSMMEMSGEDTQGFQMTSNVTDLKILMDDGSEIPGQIVLRDKDLDLAFIRPTDPLAEPIPSLDLANTGTPEILDPVFTITKLGRVAGREYAVSIERINSVVTRPRTYYIPGNDPTQTGLGSPTFTADGKIVGIFVMRTVKGAGAGMMSMMRGMSDTSMAIIVPAGDIAEIAAQAPEKGEEIETPAEEEPAASEEPAENEDAGEGEEAEDAEEDEEG